MMTLETLLEKANRRLNVSGMNKETADKTRQVIEEMYKLGIYVGVAQGFRSIQEQNDLYLQGRRGIKGEKIVTNAKGGQSNHNFGVAVDLFQYSSDGTEAIWSVDVNFKKIVDAMKAKNFKWGGDWTGFKDYPHFELYNVVGGETPKACDGEVKVTPTPTPSTGGIIGKIRILVDGLNIRSGAGREHPSIGRAVKGRVYNVTANYKNYWMEIIVDNQTKGWVSTGHEEGKEYVAMV